MTTMLGISVPMLLFVYLCKCRGGCISRRNGDTRDTDNSGIELDERLKNIEPKMVELIMNEVNN